MIKKILFVQIISLMLSSCSSFPLEERPVSYAQKDTSLKITEIMIIKSQIEDKWVQPVGDLENIIVKTKLELDIDGTVTKAEIISITCPPGTEQICPLVAETTQKAAKNASPIKNLRTDRYDIWKTVELDFYPGNYKPQ